MPFVKNSINGVLTLRARDSLGANVDLEVPTDLGDFAVSDLAEVLNQIVTFQRRGKWFSDGYGERLFPKLSWTCYHTNETAVAPGSVQAFLLRQPPYDGNVSVQGEGRPYAIDVICDIEGVAGGDSTDWSSTFLNCPVLPLSFQEDLAGGDKWNVQLECHGSVTGDLDLAEVS